MTAKKSTSSPWDPRRRKCAIVPDIFDTTQRSGAPSVTESLVSSGTTPGELPSVQRIALIASRPARKVTADVYADSKPPEHPPNVVHPSDTVFCPALRKAPHEIR